MLDHQKKVLQAVSDHPALFKKELMKSVEWLNEKELNDLQRWLRCEYYNRYSHIIDECFNMQLDVAS